MAARRYKDKSPPTQAPINRLRSRSFRTATQTGRGLFRVERQDLVADAEVVDAAIPRREIQRDVHLVAVVEPEARRHDDLLVADLLEALGDHVMPVDRHRAVERAQEP